MSQYRIGTVSVTNGSAIVTAVDPDPADALISAQQKWLTEAKVGYLFVVAGGAQLYTVLTVDSDTQLTLSAPFAEASTVVSGVPNIGFEYALVRDFSINFGFPLVTLGDIATALIIEQAMRQVDGEFITFNALVGGATPATPPTPPPPPASPPAIDIDPPSVPPVVYATVTGDTTTTVSWLASTDAGGGTVAGYRVFRDGTFIGEVLAGLIYSDSGLVAATQYSYTVSAFDNATQANVSAESMPFVALTDAAAAGAYRGYPYSIKRYRGRR